jgi:hypothetical protein
MAVVQHIGAHLWKKLTHAKKIDDFSESKKRGKSSIATAPLHRAFKFHPKPSQDLPLNSP